jgi:hypothetical protein
MAISFNATFFNQIYNEFYWDPNLQDATRILVKSNIGNISLGTSLLSKPQPDVKFIAADGHEIDAYRVDVNTTNIKVGGNVTDDFILQKAFAFSPKYKDETTYHGKVPTDVHIQIDTEFQKELRGTMIMNSLRRYAPNFMYTYANNSFNRVLYFENIQQASTLETFMETDISVQANTPGSIMSKYLGQNLAVAYNNLIRSIITQVAYSLQIMGNSRVTHSDLHLGNILLRPCHVNTFIEYVIDENRVFVPTFGAIATLIDFGRVQQSSSHWCERIPITSGFDFAKFLLHMTRCIHYNTTPHAVDQNIKMSVQQALGGIFSSIPGMRGGLIPVNFSVNPQPRSDTRYGQCMQRYPEHDFFFPSCTGQLAQEDALTILSRINNIPSATFYSSTAPRSVPVIGCGTFTERCTITTDQYLRMFATGPTGVVAAAIAAAPPVTPLPRAVRHGLLMEVANAIAGGAYKVYNITKPPVVALGKRTATTLGEVGKAASRAAKKGAAAAGTALAKAAKRGAAAAGTALSTAVQAAGSATQRAIVRAKRKLTGAQ